MALMAVRGLRTKFNTASLLDILVYIPPYYFQNVDEARKFMAFFYPSMGQPLPEKHYAEDCRLYTPGHPDGDFQVLMDKIDFYVPAHFIGWIVKVENGRM